MKILVTGSNGFLAKNLLEGLKDHTVYTLDLFNADYNYDLSKEIPKFNHKFQLIIHCAGKAHVVPKNENEKKEFYDVNHQGTINLCKGLNKVSQAIVSLVLISSVSVYGLDEGSEIDESFELLGESAYAKSKVLAEEYIADWSSSNKINYLILRLPLIVGSLPPGNLGKMINAIQRGRFFLVAKGQARKSMVNASDLSSLILRNLDKRGVYNLSDGHHPSFKEIEEIISKRLGVHKSPHLSSLLSRALSFVGDIIPIFPFNSRTLAKMTKDLTFADKKAREELGWIPSSCLENIKDIKLR